MKVNVEVDCTPEEMRRLMGLPDLGDLHARFIAKFAEAMEGGTVRPEMIETMMRGWAPMGEAGLAMWRRMMERTGEP